LRRLAIVFRSLDLHISIRHISILSTDGLCLERLQLAVKLLQEDEMAARVSLRQCPWRTSTSRPKKRNNHHRQAQLVQRTHVTSSCRRPFTPTPSCQLNPLRRSTSPFRTARCTTNRHRDAAADDVDGLARVTLSLPLSLSLFLTLIPFLSLFLFHSFSLLVSPSTSIGVPSLSAGGVCDAGPESPFHPSPLISYLLLL
jgi:hypothetical protein